MRINKKNTYLITITLTEHAYTNNRHQICQTKIHNKLSKFPFQNKLIKKKNIKMMQLIHSILRVQIRRAHTDIFKPTLGMTPSPAVCLDKIKSKQPWNFSWIVPSHLAATSCPSTLEELKFIKEQGISNLVTLSPEFQPATKQFPGIGWSYIPIAEFEAPSLDDIRRFIDISEEHRSRHEGIAIHCRAGRGRTGTMAACYLVHFYDVSPEAAITKIRLMRPGSVETYSQEKAVANYRDYLRSA